MLHLLADKRLNRSASHPRRASQAELSIFFQACAVESSTKIAATCGGRAGRGQAPAKNEWSHTERARRTLRVHKKIDLGFVDPELKRSLGVLRDYYGFP